MEKVKLPREVAEAIDRLKKEGFRAYHIVCIIHESRSYHDRVSVLRDFVIEQHDELMQALVNGYEVEETPEERAIQWLIKKNCIMPGFSEHDIVMGIKSILQKGVND